MARIKSIWKKVQSQIHMGVPLSRTVYLNCTLHGCTLNSNWNQKMIYLKYEVCASSNIWDFWELAYIMISMFQITSILIKFSVGLSVWVSVFVSVCSTLETLFLKLFAKFLFHIEQTLGSILGRIEFENLK